jgi:hypothetical protein
MTDATDDEPPFTDIYHALDALGDAIAAASLQRDALAEALDGYIVCSPVTLDWAVVLHMEPREGEMEPFIAVQERRRAEPRKLSDHEIWLLRANGFDIGEDQTYAMLDKVPVDVHRTVDGSERFLVFTLHLPNEKRLRCYGRLDDFPLP